MTPHILSIVALCSMIAVPFARSVLADDTVAVMRSDLTPLRDQADRGGLAYMGGNFGNAISFASIVRLLELPKDRSVLGEGALRRYQLVATAMQRMPPQDVDLAVACVLAAADLCGGDIASERLRLAILTRIAFVFDETARPQLLPDRMRAGGVPVVPSAPEFADAATAEASPLSWRDGQPRMIATTSGGDMNLSAALDEWRTAVQFLPKRDLEAFARGRDYSELIHDLLIELDPELSHDDEDPADGDLPGEDGK